MTKLQVYVVILAATTATLAAQQKPSFEVASVKPNKSDNRGMSWPAQPGG